MTDGAGLARGFWDEVVLPLVADRFPDLRVAAALLGPGSEVLGLDDDVSQDHDWGPRLTLLVPAGRIAEVDRALSDALPGAFRGWPVRFTGSGGDVARHHVAVRDLGGLLHERLGFDPRGSVDAADWLSLTGQAVLELTAGPVLADPDGEVADLRGRIARYPDAVRRVALAADWLRIDQELPLMGRCGQVGDEVGARLLAARIARAAMHLAFLLHDRWAPYPKWFGTCFSRLPGDPGIPEALVRATEARRPAERQRSLADALRLLHAEQERQGLSESAGATAPFFGRPFLHVDPALIGSLLAPVRDAALLGALPGGTAEQRTDDVALLTDPARRRLLVTA